MTRQQLRMVGVAMLVTALGLSLRAHGEDPQPLLLNEVVEGQTRDAAPMEYEVEVESPGILTVAVRSRAGEDLLLKVVDQFYQPVLGGDVDLDLGGDLGAEQLAATLSRPGKYRVLVETYDPQARFWLVSGFNAFPQLGEAAQPMDPHGTPDEAHRLEIGETHTTSLNPAEGDMRDWYRVEAPGNGQLIITTRGDEGDLVLNAYEPGHYREAVAFSDQDLQGSPAHEAIVLDVREGEVYLIQVAPWGQGMVPSYTIRATFAAE